MKSKLLIFFILLEFFVFLLSPQFLFAANKNDLTKLIKENSVIEQYPETDNQSDDIDLSQDNLIYKKAIGLFQYLYNPITEINMQVIEPYLHSPAGNCEGLTTLWLYSKWLKSSYPKEKYNYNNDWFKYIKNFIATWNSTKGLSSKELANWHEFISLIDFFQSSRFYIIDHFKWNVESILNYGRLDTKEIYLKKRYAIVSTFTVEQLYNLLTKIVRDNEWVYVKFNYHITGLFKDREYYYYFDPNEPKGEYKSDSLEKIAKKIITLSQILHKQTSSQFDGIYNVSKELEDAIEASERKNIFISFVVMGNNDKDQAEYPKATEFLKECNLSLDSYSLYQGASLAIRIGSIDSLKFFLDQNHGAALKNELHEMFPLIAKVAITPYGSDFFIDMSVGNQRLEAMQELLSRGVDPNKIINLPPLNVTSKKTILVETSISQSPLNGKTALHLAAARGDINMINLLINDQHTNINQGDIFGKTALIYAEENNQAEAALLLLCHGASKINTEEYRR